jgi:hypothetical protein
MIGEKQMKLELKNIKVHLGLSEETHAYTAMLYADGKKAVEVSNQGRGGGDRQLPVNGHSVKEINDWCKATLPKWQISHDLDEKKKPVMDLFLLVTFFLTLLGGIFSPIIIHHLGG